MEKELKIGNVKLRNNILLAPMAGVTDKAFRKLAIEHGAGLVCTEMVSSKAVFYEDKKTERLMDTSGEERPIVVQIFGCEPEVMAYSVKSVSKFCDIIDINMGCPVPKVVKNGEGSKLLQNLDLAEEIIKVVVDASNCPVTVKMRLGWDEDHIVALELAKKAQKAGASAVTIHARTREQYYSGEADWMQITKIKEALDIPVIGNGDVTSPELAKKMLEETKADGVMIGRGALGNPWIFEQTISFLHTGVYNIPGNKEKLETILKHIDYEISEKGEDVAIKEMRKHIGWYIRNLKDAAKVREKINKTTSKNEMEECIKEYFGEP